MPLPVLSTLLSASKRLSSGFLESNLPFFSESFAGRSFPPTSYLISSLRRSLQMYMFSANDVRPSSLVLSMLLPLEG